MSNSIYTNLLIIKEPMDFYFKPQPGGFPDNILRVAPDILPEGAVYIKQVWIDGFPHKDFDAKGLTIKLPADYDNKKVRVRLYPSKIDFEAALLESSNGTVKVDLSGTFEGPVALDELEDEFDRPEIQQAQNLILQMKDLNSISPKSLRYLASYVTKKNRENDKFNISAEGAKPEVKKALEQSQLSDQIKLV